MAPTSNHDNATVKANGIFSLKFPPNRYERECTYERILLIEASAIFACVT